MNRLYIFLLGITLFTTSAAQDTLRLNHWTGGTAMNLSSHRWELGLLSTSAYGINNRLELSAHPLAFFLVPQAKIKIGWANLKGIRIASEHGIYCPTPFLRLVAAKGTGGLISPEFDIPFMVAITNRLLISVPVARFSLFTFSSGITFALKAGYLDPRSTIDLPLIYPRLAVFYSQPEFDLSAGYRGRIYKWLGWDFRVTNYILANTEENYFMENKGVLVYTSKKSTLRVEGGYKLCFGKYPAGPQWHLLPAVDVVFGIGR
jgi:hypothetical protein